MPKKRTTRTAAEGERSAIRGFVPQYRWAAQNMLERWGSLTWVKMVDRQAGQVDDVVLGFSSNLVEAHQLKWSTFPGTFSWGFLFAAEKKGGELSLIAQLADGWKRLRGLYPGQAIRVRLVTNERPSSDRRSVSNFKPAKEPPDFHLAGFLVHVWEMMAANTSAQVPEGWDKVWKAAQEATGLTDETEFRQFIGDCRIDYGSTLREPMNLQESSDLKDLTDLLFNEVAGKKSAVEFSREEVMQRLGWTRRFQVERSHDFPVPGNYRHLENTSRALEEAIRTFPSGYLMLEGPPGSGKSTLLSRFSPASAQVVRYFAYLPADQDPHRLTSGALLRDLSVSLSCANEAKIARTLEPEDEGYLSRRLLKHLEDLHARYVAEGLKTIIIIDGLVFSCNTNSMFSFLGSCPDKVLLLRFQMPTGLC